MRFGRCVSFCGVLAVLCAIVLGAAPAGAQTNPRIVSPQEGQDVRGEIIVRWEGIPEGGYAILKVDNQFKQASAQTTYLLNTFPPTFPADGPHTITVIAKDSSNKTVGTTTVTFNVANNKIDPTAEGIRLTHWVRTDRLGSRVLRYRLLAQSDANVEEPATGGAGGGGGYPGGGSSGGGSSGGGSSGGASSGGGGGGGAADPAALDFQYSALLRRMVRDVDMIDGSANIKTAVQDALQRQREGASVGGEGGSSGGSSGGGRSSGGGGASMPGVKPPWADWAPAPENGQSYIKTIKPSGEEVNATRKAPTIGLTDLLPIFPPGEVRPGSAWETTMTFIGELSSRQPVNVLTRMVFTGFENFTTPNGASRRAAKLESRFRLPESEAKRISLLLAEKLGTQGGGGGEGASGEGASSGSAGRGHSSASSGAGGAGSGVTLEQILSARTNVARVLWFDVERRRVLRSEDSIDTYFEMEGTSGGGGEGGSSGGSSGGGYPGARGGSSGGYPGGGSGGYPGGGSSGGPGAGGGAAAPAEPTKVTYNLRMTTYLDDRVPAPSDRYTAGAGTAHSRDSVQEPSIGPVAVPES